MHGIAKVVLIFRIHVGHTSTSLVLLMNLTDQRKNENVCRVPPSAYSEPPTIIVTFLPARSERGPDSRAPTRAPMENTETIAPCSNNKTFSQFNEVVKFYKSSGMHMVT